MLLERAAISLMAFRACRRSVNVELGIEMASLKSMPGQAPDAGLLDRNQRLARLVGKSKLKASIPKSRRMMTLRPVSRERGAPWVAP